MNLWEITILAINAVMVIACLIGFRFSMAALIGVSSTTELADKNNHALGMVIASGMLALMLIMAGAISGEASTPLNEMISIAAFTLIGMVLLKVGMWVLDHWVLKDIDLMAEIKGNNVAAAIVVASNLIATGLVLQAAIYWTEGDLLTALMMVCLVFVCSLLPLTATSYLRKKVYASRNIGASWQQAIKGGNTALAMRYAGHILGTSIVIQAASDLLVYLPNAVSHLDPSAALLSLAYWLLVSLVLVPLVWILYRIAQPIVLHGVNVVEEVDQQHNTGVACIEAVMFIGFALLIKMFISG